MPAPKKPNTKAARAALAARREADRAEKEAATAAALFGNAEGKSLMLDIMRKRRKKIESDMASLLGEHEEVSAWLAEHDSIDLAGLTARLGCEPHDQEAVLSWSGERAGHRWTEQECQELMRAWAEDAARIARDSD